MRSSRIYLISSILPLAVFFPSCLIAWNPPDAGTLLQKMEEAYAGVKDYQANMEIRAYRKDGSYKTKRFLYTFQKPNRIRLDFGSPYAGMIVVYPDREGKVVLRWFFTIHLAPDHSLLQDSSGQRIDQTGMGLLIEKMAESLTDHRRGPWEITEDEKEIRIRVVADDHFRKGVVTRYHFFIDKKLFLPVRVEELTTGGLLERTIVFRSLKMNIDVPDSFFQLNGS